MAVTDDREVKRAGILEAATAQFIKYGIAKTSMHDIAKSVGLTTQSLYYYFEDKTAIILGVIVNVTEQYLKQLGAALKAAANINQVIDASVLTWVNLHKQYPMLKFANDTFTTTGINIPALHQAMQQTAMAEAELLQAVTEKFYNIKAGQELHQDVMLFLASRAGLTKILLYSTMPGLKPVSTAFTELDKALKAFGRIYMGGLKIKYKTEE